MFIHIPIPSMSASITPPTTAADAMALGPALAASTPPVAAPLTMEFHGSSFCLTADIVQSQHAKSPPQTANCPPMTGAREAQFPRAPDRRDPEGDSQAPFPRCQIPPPMAPKAKAPPTSSMMRYGHGSRSDMLELLIVRLVVRSVVAGLLSSSIPPPAAAAPARGFGTAAGFVPSPRARRSLFFHVRRYGSYRDPILLARCLSSSSLDLFPPRGNGRLRARFPLSGPRSSLGAVAGLITGTAG